MEKEIISRGRFGGRTAGVKNKRTRELEAATKKAQKVAEDILGSKCFVADAHTLLCMVYKSDEYPIELRVDAAKAAIGYEKPRLAAVMAKVEASQSYESLIIDAVKLRHEMDLKIVREGMREISDE